ncbi:MAG: DUF5719 family protein [Actinomycetota bacterium]
MRSARLTSVLILGGAIVGGLALQAADEPARPPDSGAARVIAGVALPAARTEPTLSSTWYCAGGTAAPGGFADHAVLIANPTDEARTATITVLTGSVADAPDAADLTTTTTVAGQTTTTTTAPTTTTVETTTTTRPPPVQKAVELPAQSRIEVRLGDIAKAQLAGAVIEVDGGEVAVEHQITGPLGRATAPCSTTASPTWSFPWGVTERGARELLVFMNPFPDDATVDIAFATDEGVRETARFEGFIVPGRSVVGAYIDEDVTRKAQVSALVRVGSGRLVIDRIQTFNGTDEREGMTLALGVPTPALEWIYPVGETGPGLSEQVVVFNPSDDVAEVEVEVRLDDPAENLPPEPFELTVPPGRYSIIDVHAEERVPAGVGHALLVRSLNEVPITAERVNVATDPAPRRGVSVTTGSPLGAPTWYFPGGGPTAERDEFLVLFNLDDEAAATVNVTGFSQGRTIAIPGLQGAQIPPGGRLVIRVGDHYERDDLPVVVAADKAIVAERGLYRIGGGGMAQSMGIPLATGIVVPDPLAG